MSETSTPETGRREAVASFSDRVKFRHAVSALIAAGFDPSDLSVLATHESLASAQEEAGGRHEILPAGLTEEIKFIEPLTDAGIILMSAGPVAAAIAALLAAGLGASALKEIFDRFTGPRHREDFTAALKAGAALLWVRCAAPDLEPRAMRILQEAGGRHVHVYDRPPEDEAHIA